MITYWQQNEDGKLFREKEENLNEADRTWVDEL